MQFGSIRSKHIFVPCHFISLSLSSHHRFEVRNPNSKLRLLDWDYYDDRQVSDWYLESDMGCGFGENKKGHIFGKEIPHLH